MPEAEIPEKYKKKIEEVAGRYEGRAESFAEKEVIGQLRRIAKSKPECFDRVAELMGSDKAINLVGSFKGGANRRTTKFIKDIAEYKPKSFDRAIEVIGQYKGEEREQIVYRFGHLARDEENPGNFDAVLEQYELDLKRKAKGKK